MSLAPDRQAGAEAALWVIEPQRDQLWARVVEFWRYRRVLWFLASRAVQGRYEGTTLGIFWLFARPLIPILIAALVFGGFLRIPSEGVPYLLFFLTGVVPWQLFERSVLFGTRGLEQHRSLIKKLYFPRIMAPLASMAPAVVDFFVFIGLVIGVGLFYLWQDGRLYLRVGPAVLVGLAMMVFAILCAFSVVLWTSILQVRHRDVRFTMRYVMQFWFYLTPVFYPVSAVPPDVRWIVHLNPIAAVVATFRWVVIGVGEFSGERLAGAAAVAALATVVGVWFFAANESSAIDRL